MKLCTVKPVLRGHSKEEQKLVLKTDYRLMQVKSIAECSDGSILQYFRPSLSYYLSLRPLFMCNFEWPLKTGFTVSINTKPVQFSIQCMLHILCIFRDCERNKLELTYAFNAFYLFNSQNKTEYVFLLGDK